MRIVIDLQGAQATESRNRGMGRYSMSLAKSMVKLGKNHEFHIVLNGAFVDAVESIRSELEEWLPQDRFHIFPQISPIDYINPEHASRRTAAEICREAFIANLNPDFVHISSLFEGLSDNTVSSIGRVSQSCPVSVTLYDLIPLIGRDIYLENPDVERWYEDRLLHLRRADVLLAISESSAREAIDYLGFPAERVINVGTDADPQFLHGKLAPAKVARIHAKFGIKKPFVMYTGGVDPRKNMDGLVAAYAALPRATRKEHQLVIVCALRSEQRKHLELVANRVGLAADEIVFTGFAPETDLIALYKTCKLFIFPSWHEGFGLPALEAMRCGAPVIGSNRSSLPEVIGMPGALFDPLDEDDMRDRLEKGLGDSKFRDLLIQNAEKQSRKFSWDATGKAAIEAIEAVHSTLTAAPRAVTPTAPARKRLAFVSPILPAESGIAEYAAELIPALSRHYDIEIIVKDEESAEQITDTYILSNLPIRTIDWMKRNFSRYERVVYHVGNSIFHNHMFEALPSYPGVVVLHDYFLSGMVSSQQYHFKIADAWFKELYYCHGYSALRFQQVTNDLLAVLMRYPTNKSVVENAVGMIVHSPHSIELGSKWAKSHEPHRWHLIPHLRAPVLAIDRVGARARLGLDQNDLIVCSFGFVSPTKQSLRIAKAWVASPLAKQANAKLVFVGANNPGHYGEEMVALIEQSGAGNSITISGWADSSTFRDYLAASDVGVQLRTMSRGETSGSVLDAMNYELATIVNRHGSMGHLPDDAVFMLPDEFTDQELTDALIRLSQDADLRSAIGSRARAVIEEAHSPFRCAEAYMAAIEGSYDEASGSLHSVLKKLRFLRPETWPAADLVQVAVAAEVATTRMSPTSYLDVTDALISNAERYDNPAFDDFVRGLFAADLPRRLEPIYYDRDSEEWRYARKATLRAIQASVPSLTDDRVIFAPSSDVFRFGERQGGSTSRTAGSELLIVVRQWTLSRGDEQTMDGPDNHPLSPVFRKLGYIVTTQAQKPKKP